MFNKIPTDKQFYLLCCFILALVAWLYSGPLIPDWPIVFVIIVRTLIALVFAAIFAVGKEFYDSKQKGNHFCRKDLRWDAVGAVLGCVTAIVHLVIS